MAMYKSVTPIIVKKLIRSGHSAPHGSSTWKIALADFMTAMFIIFLLLWLINQTTPEVRHGVAQYFAPRSLSQNNTGADGSFSGDSPTQPGPQRTAGAPLNPITGGGPSSPQNGDGVTEVPGYPGAQPVALNADATDAAQLIQRRIRQALQETPELRAFEQNIQVEPTKEGVRLQLIDTNKQELFSSGDAKPTAQIQALMKAVAYVVAGLPHPITITGHTDAQLMKRKDYSNWDLSSDRAHTARRLLQEYGVDESRVALVAGVADREPLDPAHLAAPMNRRISITLLTQPIGGGQAEENRRQPMQGLQGPAPLGRLIQR